VKRLLVVKSKGTRFYLRVIEESEIVKNPIPILWFNEGIYGWIPVKVVKNEIIHYVDNIKLRQGSITISELRFTWDQVQQLPNDIGEILMAFAEEQK